MSLGIIHRIIFQYNMYIKIFFMHNLYLYRLFILLMHSYKIKKYRKISEGS